MTEPTTPNVGLIVPGTGDLVGTWGSAAVNPNFTALDGMFGGVQSIALSSATTILLTTPSASLTPIAGPNQSQNACLYLNGTLTGTATLQFTMPGRYVIHNKCTVGNYCVVLAPSAGTGNVIGAPPGQKATVFFDGTNMDYVDTLPVGAAFDLHGATAIPTWIKACTVAPYLLKDGSTYSSSIYSALAAQLGSTFGGNGVTTFAVPDERARMRVPYDPNSTGRMTSPVNASLMNSSGGAQTQTIAQGNLPNYSLPVVNGAVTMITNLSNAAGGGGSTAIELNAVSAANQNWAGANFNFSLTTNVSATLGGGGAPLTTVQPSIVSFLPLIKTVILLGVLAGGLLNMFGGYNV